MRRLFASQHSSAAVIDRLHRGTNDVLAKARHSRSSIYHWGTYGYRLAQCCSCRHCLGQWNQWLRLVQKVRKQGRILGIRCASQAPERRRYGRTYKPSHRDARTHLKRRQGRHGWAAIWSRQCLSIFPKIHSLMSTATAQNFKISKNLLSFSL